MFLYFHLFVNGLFWHFSTVGSFISLFIYLFYLSDYSFIYTCNSSISLIYLDFLFFFYIFTLFYFCTSQLFLRAFYLHFRSSWSIRFRMLSHIVHTKSLWFTRVHSLTHCMDVCDFFPCESTKCTAHLHPPLKHSIMNGKWFIRGSTAAAAGLDEEALKLYFCSCFSADWMPAWNVEGNK